MKQFKMGVMAIAALISVQSIKAQTVDEVVNKHVEAMGGKDKLASLKTVRMEATMNTQGTDVDLVITKSHMVGQRFDIAVMGMNGYQIITPTGGWAFMPFMGQTAPEAMKDEQVKSAASGLDLQGTLFNYKEKGTQLELLGKEDVDAKPAFKIKATLKSGKVITYFIDAATYYIVKSVSNQNVNGQDMEVTNGYSNYKPTEGGYIFPFTGTSMQGEMNFTKIQVNVPVDEKLFTAN